MIELLAPAKINLSLHVKGRRDDGFHELETLMCPITVFDRLEIETLGGGNAALHLRRSDDPHG
jgi:4-diphosphocytidyl-2-C-methyl-D-erythritol kinase